MNQTELISELSSFVDDNIYTPVRTAGHHENRPIPVVLIEEWDTTDYTFHNTAYAGTRQEDGERVRYYRFHWRTRVEFSVRQRSDEKASQLKDALKDVLRELRIDPKQLHDHLNAARLRESGNPSQRLVEPKESEETVTAVFVGYDQIKKSDVDSIESIEFEFTATAN